MERVIAGAARGDRDALAHLWRAHQHLLLRYFRGKGMNEPEDLASIVWIEVAKGLPSFAGDETDFRRWLFTIAARRRVDEIRRNRRERARDDRAAAMAASPPPNETAVEFERAAELDRAIALVRTLPEQQAEAVLLRIVADLSVADVATIMGVSEGNVRVLVHRGLSRLAQSVPTTLESSDIAPVDPGVPPTPTLSGPDRGNFEASVTDRSRRSISAL